MRALKEAIIVESEEEPDLKNDKERPPTVHEN